jgi:hypothetical protein
MRCPNRCGETYRRERKKPIVDTMGFLGML